MSILAVIVGYLVIGAASLAVIAGALKGIVAAFLHLTNVRYGDAGRAAAAQMASRVSALRDEWQRHKALRDEWQRHMQKEREK